MIAKKPMHSHNMGPNHPDLDYFNDKLFGYIISDNVLEHIGYHDQSLQNFYHILHKGGLLTFSLPGENTMHGTFKSKKDVHILRKNKEMHSLLRKIDKDFIEAESLITPSIFLMQIFSKSVEV